MTETIEEAILEVGIAAVDGLRLVTTFNTDGGREPMRLEPGVHELRAELEPELLPGEFVLDLGVHERVSGATVDLVERVLQFDVGVSDGEGETYAATVRGYLRAETRWEVGQAAATARLDYMRLRTPGRRRPSVLFAGQSYYHAWYLSRELRKLGWRADVLNWDVAPDSQGFYHGRGLRVLVGRAAAQALGRRATRRSTCARSRGTTSSTSPTRTACGSATSCTTWVANRFHPYAEIELLRRLGKKIVYSNNGCLDGVSQTSFASWGDRPVCLDCPWRERPEICSDERNLAWGYNRNRLAHFQCNTGDNRKDYNDDPTVHEVPQFFCLDPEFWRPDLEVPERWRLDLPAEHRAHLPRRRALPAAHGRRPQPQVQPHLRPADRADEGGGLRRRADVRARRAQPRRPLHRRCRRTSSSTCSRSAGSARTSARR